MYVNLNSVSSKHFISFIMESFDTRFHGTCIPQVLFVTNWEAYKALRDIKTKKAAGPEGIPSVVLKLFAFEL